MEHEAAHLNLIVGIENKEYFYSLGEIIYLNFNVIYRSIKDKIIKQFYKTISNKNTNYNEQMFIIICIFATH